MTDIVTIKGIGPKKIQTLSNAGYDLHKIQSSDFYNIVSLPGFGIKTTYQLFQQLGIQIQYQSMIEITNSQPENVIIENKIIKPWREHRSKRNNIVPTQPDNFTIEHTTIWSFPKRGNWASHTPQYRGNWPPQLVRNIIELYSNPGDTVLDPMVGGGTTPVECLLLNRNSISIDINPGSINITRDRLDLPLEMKKDLQQTVHKTYIGDIRNLNLIRNESINLIATHPPYVNIISYAPHINGDLSQLSDYKLFFEEFSKAISELYRVLKPGGYCAILIGDTHTQSHFIPISAHMLLDFLKAGFALKEDIIKEEWNCDSDHKLSKYGNANFLLTMHEHLFIFEKPTKDHKLPKECTYDFFK